MARKKKPRELQKLSTDEALGNAPVKDPKELENIEGATEGAGASKEAIFLEARDRFKICQDWYSPANMRFLDDLKFDAGDAINQYQWPNAIRRTREIDELPCLTINRVRQHNLHVINDMRQNKPAIKIRAVGSGSTVESARVYNSLMRHIEYVSNAQAAYDTAGGFQVRAGRGAWRITTDYEDENSFNQMPLIKRIADPLTAYLDPFAKEEDKLDAQFGFLFEECDEKSFKAKYPKFADAVAGQTLDESFGWKRKDRVRYAEYYRLVEYDDVLLGVPNPNGGEPVIFRKSELEKAPEVLAKLLEMPDILARDTKRSVVEWYFIVGGKIVDEGEWIGRYVPIIQVVGEESVIDGQYDCKGHTRALIDPQRMYNYNASIAVEYSGLQSKSPYVAPAQAIEGYEEYWRTANRINYSVLPYNGLDDAGNQIAAPVRQEPPVPMPAALAGMDTASRDMQFASGQYEAEFGAKGNERSAKALDERERASSTSTFHYVDNMAKAIRATGKQIMDLIPKVYDTRRAFTILAEDGTSLEMIVDPSAAEAVKVRQQVDMQAVQQVLFNPNVGKYDVQADVGPDWGTKRQETFHALSLILTQSPQLTTIIGDLLLQSSDFELAEEAAARLRRMVPKEALGLGPSQNEQMMKAQIEQLTTMLKQTLEELTKEKIKLKGKESLRQVNVFEAYTKRLKAVADAARDAGRAIAPEELSALADQVVAESLDLSLDEVLAAGSPTLRSAAEMGKIQRARQEEPAPVEGAQKAPDGNWYVESPEGGFSRVDLPEGGASAAP